MGTNAENNYFHVHRQPGWQDNELWLQLHNDSRSLDMSASLTLSQAQTLGAASGDAQTFASAFSSVVSSTFLNAMQPGDMESYRALFASLHSI